MVACDICQKKVKKSWLKLHKMHVHSTEKNHLCEECGKSFALKSNATDELSSYNLFDYTTLFDCQDN